MQDSFLFIWFQLYWFWFTYICLVGEKTEENETEACFKTNCFLKKEGDIRSVLSSIIIKPCASLAYSSYILSLFSFNNF